MAWTASAWYFAPPLDSESLAEFGGRLGLEPVIVGSSLQILEHRQVVLKRSGRGLEDEIRKMAVIGVRAQRDRTRLPLQSSLKAEAGFRIEVRFADLERLARAMRTVREELVDRRSTRASRNGQAGPPAGENSYWPPSDPDQVVKLRERSGVNS